MDFLICTTNQGKVKEFKNSFLNVNFQTLKDEKIFLEIEETGSTFEENALLKLKTIIDSFPHLKEKYDFIIAEDSGLCVEILNGAPGIYSARYSGKNSSDYSNNQKLLSELNSLTNRNAFYIACIACYHNNKYKVFQGELHGTIAKDLKGENGFGYDPLFIPNGYSQTFGELDPSIKLRISHRSRALNKMAEYVNY